MAKLIRKGFLKNSSGNTPVEAAVIVPIMALLYFGLIDITGIITVNRKLTSTAAMIGDTVTQYQDVIASPQVNDIFNAVNIIMQPTPASKVHVDVYGYYMNGSTVSVRWAQHSTGSGGCPAPVTAGVGALMIQGNDLIVTVD